MLYRVYLAWAVASIFYAYQYILRVFPNIAMTDIMHHFGLDARLFGQFSGVYYLGYALAHLPIGACLDRFGPRRVLPLSMLLTCVGMAPLVMADQWIWPLIGRLFIGIGSSAAILGVFKIIQLSFKEEQFTRMLSFAVTIGLVGAIYGGEPVNILKNAYGFKSVILLLIGMGILLSFLSAVFLPSAYTEQSEYSLQKGLRAIIFNPTILFICLLSGLMVGPLEGFADVWGTAFLEEVYGLNDALAATLPSLIFAGMCFGGPVLSFIAERIKSSYGVILACAVVMGGGFVALLSGALNVTSLFLLFAIIGVCCAYQILAIAQVSTYVSKQFSGLATAGANMIIMLFGYLFHSSIGIVMSRYATGSSLDPTYGKQAFILGISIIPLALLISSLGFLYIILRKRQVDSGFRQNDSI